MNYKKYIIPIIIVIIWSIISIAGIFPKILFPSPTKIITYISSWEILFSVIKDLAYTSTRLFVGFSVGAVIGISLGILMGKSESIYNLCEFIIDFFRSIPIAALFPVFIIFFGIGELSKITTVIWSSSLIVLVHTMYGVKTCSIIRQKYARILHANNFQILYTIIIPESLPSIIAGLRTGVSIALIVVVLTEMFLSTSIGLGQRIFNSALVYKTTEMYFIIMLTGVLGYFINQSFIKIENYLLQWNKSF